MAGTIDLTSHQVPPRWGGTGDLGIGRVALLCTADAADGSFPETTLESLGVKIQGTILSVVTDPGATAPTASYDLTLIDDSGLDKLAGRCLNRDAATSEHEVIGTRVSINETLTVTIAGNLVNEATIAINILYSPTGIDSPPWLFDSNRNLNVADTAAQTSLGVIEDAVHAEDDPHVSADSGILMLGVRNDAATELADTDGDYVPIALDGYGNMRSRPAGGGTGTVASVDDTNVSTTLLAANAERQEVRIFNNSDQYLYIKFGATASATDFTERIDPYTGWVDDRYTGIIDGIWAADSTGAALITEVD